jgi:hypothetical protein
MGLRGEPLTKVLEFPMCELLAPAKIIAQTLSNTGLIREKSVRIPTQVFCAELLGGCSRNRATATGTEESEIIIGINTGTVTIMPA